jgi:hypothetical protein
MLQQKRVNPGLRRGSTRQPGAALAIAIVYSVMRFKIKQVCAIVLMCAIVFATFHEMDRRRVRFRAVASYHGSRIAGLGFGCSHEFTWFNRSGQLLITLRGDESEHYQAWQVKQRWHRAMKGKYAYASLHPWVPLLRDPPEPPDP